ncbi:MAG: TIGR04282 family arsenosugar biosynthesis glycosyltransferase [Limisphaerales bacterium]
MTDRLVVFARAPRPGAVKRRLAAALGDEGACGAYATLARHVLGQLGAVSLGELRHTPDDAGREVADWLPPGWSLAPQGEGDLGARMARALTAHFQQGAARMALVGSDCPDVGAADIHAAWRSLADHELVLGPAEDGGYWLIGLRAAAAGWETLFRDMPWGTARVLAETLRRAEAAGLRAARLRTLRDVDKPADWEDWRSRGGAGATSGQPARPPQGHRSLAR